MQKIERQNSCDFFYNALKNDKRLTKLVDELKSALVCYKDDEISLSIRENIVFRQFADKILTDSERADYYNLPEGCRMRENAKIISPENLKCGKYVWIGENAILDASGGLEIGDHTTVATSVFVWSHSSHMANINMANYPRSEFIERKPTKIGSGVFIAGPSVIVAGTTIGDRTIILPMSCVTESFEGNCMIGGSPAKIIKTL
jgi:acetyltransferase-like isoleucine patch superfamily enzyme